jgi:hypothetical protein
VLGLEFSVGFSALVQSKSKGLGLSSVLWIGVQG